MPIESAGSPFPPHATTHRYSVPVVYHDMPAAEALLQAFDSLKHLDNVVNDIFSRITNRVRSERQAISNITSRLEKASNAISQIAQSTSRVTTIYSTSKYPAPKTLPDFTRPCPPADDTTELFPNSLRGVRHRLTAAQKKVMPNPADTAPLLTSLTQARLMRADAHLTKSGDDEAAEGLGRLPAYLPSVTSMLLFNTEENPYKSYVSINNLEGAAGQDRKQESSGPSAAPKSVIDGADLPMFAGFQFDYKPLLGDLPTFDLPTNLPLGKLADISFTAENQQLSIAPSSATLPQLPSFDMLALPDVSSIHRKEKLSAVPTFSSAASAPPPPPPSSIPSAPTSSQVSSSTVVLGTDNVPPPPPPGPPIVSPSAPPPPPPPGPPPGPVAPSAPKAAAPASGGRAALLDAIRDKSNMSRLKKAKTTGPGEGGKPGPAAPVKKRGGDSGGGDMMSALRERLAARQHAISGKNQDDVVSSASTAPPASSRLAAPRLNKAPRRSNDAAEDAQEDDSESTDSSGKKKLSDVVIQAYVDAHAKKQAADEKEDEW